MTHFHRAVPNELSYRTVPASRRDHRDGRRAEWDCEKCGQRVVMFVIDGMGHFRHKAER